MKIKTNIKAGGGDAWSNHNEKLASDNNSIEQKKSFGKKLRLSKETIRELKESDLKAIAGGITGNVCWYTAQPLHTRCICPSEKYCP